MIAASEPSRLVGWDSSVRRTKVARPLSGCAVAACLVGLAAIALAPLAVGWRRGPVATFEAFVARLEGGRLGEALFLAAALLAAGLSVAALVRLTTDRRQRGVVLAVFGLVGPALAWLVLGRVLSAT